MQKLTRSLGLQTDPVTILDVRVVERCSILTQTDVEDVNNEKVSTVPTSLPRDLAQAQDEKDERPETEAPGGAEQVKQGTLDSEKRKEEEKLEHMLGDSMLLQGGNAVQEGKVESMPQQEGVTESSEQQGARALKQSQEQHDQQMADRMPEFGSQCKQQDSITQGQIEGASEDSTSAAECVSQDSMADAEELLYGEIASVAGKTLSAGTPTKVTGEADKEADVPKAGDADESKHNALAGVALACDGGHAADEMQEKGDAAVKLHCKVAPPVHLSHCQLRVCVLSSTRSVASTIILSTPVSLSSLPPLHVLRSLRRAPRQARKKLSQNQCRNPLVARHRHLTQRILRRPVSLSPGSKRGRKRGLDVYFHDSARGLDVYCHDGALGAKTLRAGSWTS